MIRAKITQTCFVAGGRRLPGDVVLVPDQEFAPHCMEEITEQKVVEESPLEGEQPEAVVDNAKGDGPADSQTRKRVVKKA